MSEFDRFIREGDEPVDEFVRECEEMMTVKFILAERKISELLITIATSKKLSDVVAACSRGFDFYDALSASRIKAGKRWSLLPPVRMREQIAFAVNLLYAFDVRAIPLQEFLDPELKELYSVAGGMAESVKRRDARLIRTSMTGLTAVIRGGCMAERLSEKTAELDETLRHFGI